MDTVREIDAVLRDPALARDRKIRALQELARRCWEEVFPEGWTNVSPEMRSERWANLRSEIEGYADCDQILAVLDWPASGGNFHWLK
jgi:hypothetical protein